MAVRDRQTLLTGKDVELERVRCDVTQVELAEQVAQATGRPRSSWATALTLIESGVPELTQGAYSFLLEQVHEAAAVKTAAKTREEQAA